MRTQTNPSRLHARAGFTLVELLVAVAVVILLSIGIGQLFSNVSRLVSTGSAVAEVDALARAMEKQIRDDFERMSALPSDETFLAIRSRRQREVYLTADDEEADRRQNIEPGDPGSRAFSTRLDEVLFLAEAGGSELFQTAQQAGDEYNTVFTPVARIMYGHALKPVLDPDYAPDPEDIDFDTADPANEELYRERIWYADGDFGSGPTAQGFNTTQNRFSPTNSTATGRNQFAGGFPLARHELLIAGGLAYSYEEPSDGSLSGRARNVALYARDLDTIRFNEIDSRVFESTHTTGDPPFFRVPAFQDLDVPGIGLIRQGRVDICVQSPESLKRWIEGVEARAGANVSIPPPLPPDASAFDAGYFDIGAEEWRPDAFAIADRPLWLRRTIRNGQVAPPGLSSAQVRPYNTRLLKSAIAGMFNRILVETEPTTIQRVIPDDSEGTRPEQTLMDYHAVIASRCSRFEVYWSDGTRWRGPDSDEIDLSGDGSNIVTYSEGDIVWFGFNTPREALLLPGAVSPEVLRGTRNDRLNVTNDGLSDLNLEAAYDVERTAAALDFRDEYLAIWGYRLPGASGFYEAGGWPKPALLKFRMTLHDSQFRLQDGKTFEFIIEIDNQQGN
jgi:prepilin-type N-terminal cleavage/methylation domain-containing protein